MVASLLQQITVANDHRTYTPASPVSPTSSPPLHSSTLSSTPCISQKHAHPYTSVPQVFSRFHAQTVPSISILSYMNRILKYAPCSNCVFISILVYLDRMARAKFPFLLCSSNIHRSIIVCVMVATKFASDVFYTNAHYAKVGGLQLTELNQLELEFLFMNDFNLLISLEEFHFYSNRLLEHAVQEQKRTTMSPSPFSSLWVPNPPPSPLSSSPHHTTTASLSSAYSPTPSSKHHSLKSACMTHKPLPSTSASSSSHLALSSSSTTTITPMITTTTTSSSTSSTSSSSRKRHQTVRRYTSNPIVPPTPTSSSMHRISTSISNINAPNNNSMPATPLSCYSTYPNTFLFINGGYPTVLPYATLLNSVNASTSVIHPSASSSTFPTTTLCRNGSINGSSASFPTSNTASTSMVAAAPSYPSHTTSSVHSNCCSHRSLSPMRAPLSASRLSAS